MADTHQHGLDPELPFITTKFEWLVQWARQSAIWPAQFGLVQIEVPEADYTQLASLDSCAEYLTPKFQAKA